MGGHWPVPANYGVTSAFGIKGSRWKMCGYHTGSDFAAPTGTPIYAPEDGDIRYRSYGAAYGDRAFALSPDAAHEWFFAHCDSRLPAGTRVKRGQHIGTVGARGNVTGPHLHLEYHVGKTSTCAGMRDPAAYLDRTEAPGGGGVGGGGGGDAPHVTANVYSDKLGYGEPTNGDAWSDTIKELQERLNRIKLVGGATLAVDGKYGASTDAEVRKWQEQVCHDTPDPALKSYLGPAQRARMFASPPYTIHNTGLPAVAAGGGGGGGPGGGSGGAPVPPGDGVVPPAPVLILPRAVWDPVKKAGGGWFTGLRPFVGTAKKITLHTTETTSKPNWEQQQTGIPHLTVDLITGYRWQHLTFDTAAYTLKGGEKSPNSDSGQNVQIEIIGYAAQSPGWSDAQYAELQKILMWLSVQVGIPYVFPVQFPPHHRLSWAEWEPMSGVLGHSQTPFNDHSDPGELNVDKLLTSPSAPVEPEPPIIHPQPPSGGGGADETLRAVLVAGLRRLADEIDAL